MSFRVDNEWGELKQVIVGHGRNMHAPTSAEDAFDPTSFLHLYSGTYPVMDEVVLQLDGLAEVLANFGVEVLRPHDVPDLEQVFARDVGFVVEDQFFRSAMIENREAEWLGVSPLIPEASVRSMPQHIRAEGGDVLLLDDAIAVGVIVIAVYKSIIEPLLRPTSFRLVIIEHLRFGDRVVAVGVHTFVKAVPSCLNLFTRLPHGYGLLERVRWRLVGGQGEPARQEEHRHDQAQHRHRGMWLDLPKMRKEYDQCGDWFFLRPAPSRCLLLRSRISMSMAFFSV